MSVLLARSFAPSGLTKLAEIFFILISAKSSTVLYEHVQRNYFVISDLAWLVSKTKPFSLLSLCGNNFVAFLRFNNFFFKPYLLFKNVANL